MATLQKRGRYYYVRWQKVVGDARLNVRKSLKLRYKDQAEKALETLERLEEQGIIEPYSPEFDPVKSLKEFNNKGTGLKINSVRQAADYFYQKKAHLSKATIRNAKKRTMDNSGAYEQAIEHFITLNDIADLSPLLVKKHHFEKVIFKPKIKPATRHFYFKQLRVWWNKLLEWEIVKNNYFPAIKKDLPEKRQNARPKMLTKNELHIIFKKFDEELSRKRKIKEYDSSRTQHWFKPLMAIYFYCGLRKHEAAYKSDLEYSGLKGQNLYFENGNLEMIYLPPTKGRKERSIPIPDPCRQHIKNYLKIRGKVGYDDYLFIYQGGRREGYPVTGARAYRQFKHYLKKAKLPKSRTLHGMRHQRVTKWLENGYYASEAQFMAGHSSVKVTESYTHLTGKNLLEKQREMEKRNNGIKNE